MIKALDTAVRCSGSGSGMTVRRPKYTRYRIGVRYDGAEVLMHWVPDQVRYDGAEVNGFLGTGSVSGMTGGLKRLRHWIPDQRSLCRTPIRYPV